MENLKRLKFVGKVRKIAVLREGVHLLAKYTQDELLCRTASKISIKM